jgi:hypothetical protein
MMSLSRPAKRLLCPSGLRGAKIKKRNRCNGDSVLSVEHPIFGKKNNYKHLLIRYSQHRACVEREHAQMSDHEKSAYYSR